MKRYAVVTFSARGEITHLHLHEEGYHEDDVHVFELKVNDRTWHHWKEEVAKGAKPIEIVEMGTEYQVSEIWHT